MKMMFALILSFWLNAYVENIFESVTETNSALTLTSGSSGKVYSGSQDHDFEKANTARVWERSESRPLKMFLANVRVKLFVKLKVGRISTG